MLKETKKLSFILTVIILLSSTVIAPNVRGDKSAVSDNDDKNVSVNDVSFTCCDTEDLPATNSTDQPSAPSPTNALSGNGLVNGAVAWPVLSMATGDTLPIIGTNWLLLAILGNALILIFGAFLRLHSGNSPGLRFAL
jgi:hypothetical protein